MGVMLEDTAGERVETNKISDFLFPCCVLAFHDKTFNHVFPGDEEMGDLLLGELNCQFEFLQVSVQDFVHMFRI